MANEKRLIDANGSYTLNECNETGHSLCFGGGFIDVYDPKGKHICQFWAGDAPTVDAVPVEKYEALVGMYHDLRENFVDYVCSGIRNEAPYCLNKCEECVDKRGWCKLERCQGFNPAEVILDRYAKMDGDGNG